MALSFLLYFIDALHRRFVAAAVGFAAAFDIVVRGVVVAMVAPVVALVVVSTLVTDGGNPEKLTANVTMATAYSVIQRQQFRLQAFVHRPQCSHTRATFSCTPCPLERSLWRCLCGGQAELEWASIPLSPRMSLYSPVAAGVSHLARYQ